DQHVNPVAQVFAFTAKRGHDAGLIEVEDTAVAVRRFRDGSLGQLLGATSMYPGSLKRIQIAGRDGTAELLEDELITWQFRHATDGTMPSVSASRAARKPAAEHPTRWQSTTATTPATSRRSSM